MAYTTINKSTAHFNTKLYTGNGSTQSITGVGFQPDLTWIKKRSSTESHYVYDAIRGVTKEIYPNSNTTESTDVNSLTAFGADGFSVGTSNALNENNETLASWNWKAGGSTSANTTGDIDSTVSLNSTSKFSIVSYTGNGTVNQTVGHSLGVTPDMIIIKNRDRSVLWPVINPRFVSISDPNMLYLDDAGSEADDTNIQGDNAHSSTIFGVDNYAGVNTSGEKQIAYCWASVSGFSKFGVYKGNGNANGVFIYTGFKPSFFMVKNATTAAKPWMMFDNKRDPENVVDRRLLANDSAAEDAANDHDFLSNGIKLRTTGDYFNASGSNYIYMAFGQSLVGTNDIPCTAR